MNEELTDNELLEMAFEALIPLANQGTHTDEITIEDIKRARETLRFLTERIGKQRKSR